ncbi:MAG: hypothetical protein COB15_03640 [Flavobacteriales bacterium]|nr:MAG: hypothetical protein COB15_03640 [Flavobacteriales bacterium]
MIAVKKIGLFLFLILIKFSAVAQCALCKAVLESDDEATVALAEGINSGIIYLMFIPYILMGTVGYFIYRHYKKNNQTEEV